MNPSEIITDLSASQADGLACVVCGADYLSVRVAHHTVDGADVCRVHVRPSGFPVDVKVTIDKAG